MLMHMFEIEIAEVFSETCRASEVRDFCENS